MRRIVTLGALALCVLSMHSAPSLNAYASNNHTWATSQVAYYVNPANAYVSAQAAIGAIQSAAAAWSTQSRANVQLTYAGTTSGSSATLNNKNEVFFRNASNGGSGAVTYWWYDGTGHFVDADIAFYQYDYVFFTGSSGCSGNGEYIEDVGTHEFGHALGLAHSNVGTATMYPSNTYCDQSWRSLDGDDVNGIEALYPPTSTVQPPAAPTQLGVSVNASSPTNTLALTWADRASNESGYRVEQSGDSFSWTPVAQLGVNATSYVATGLWGGTQYWYRVSAYNLAGSSSYSNTASGVTLSIASNAPPSAPSGPGPADGATTGVNTSTLAWSAAAQAQQYDVYFGTSSQPPLYASNLSATSVGLPALASGTTYYWAVVAKNAFGQTAGPTWRFTTRVQRGKKR